MDGDGDLDIVSASSLDDTIAWCENDGAADPSWTSANIATTADAARDVQVADMDGDGDLDIVSASYADDTIAWYENNGAANPSWTSSDIVTNATNAESVYLADMDGDGDFDIVSGSQGDNTVAWYENDGAADPSWTAVDISTSYDARDVFLADVDSDGDVDIVSASHNDDAITIFEQEGARQLSPQLTAPLLILQESTTPQSPSVISMLAPSQDPAFHAGAVKPLALLAMVPRLTLIHLPQSQ